MDPRSKATTAELEQQLSLALEIFGEVRRGRQALAELSAAKSSLEKLKEQLKGTTCVAGAGREAGGGDRTRSRREARPRRTRWGSRAAVSGLQSALRVVEGGDRTTPQQAIEVYRLSDDAAKSRIAEWKKLKQGQLVEFNRAVEKAGLHPIEIVGDRGRSRSFADVAVRRGSGRFVRFGLALQASANGKIATNKYFASGSMR